MEAHAAGGIARDANVVDASRACRVAEKQAHFVELAARHLARHVCQLDLESSGARDQLHVEPVVHVVDDRAHRRRRVIEAHATHREHVLAGELCRLLPVRLLCKRERVFDAEYVEAAGVSSWRDREPHRPRAARLQEQRLADRRARNGVIVIAIVVVQFVACFRLIRRFVAHILPEQTHGGERQADAQRIAHLKRDGHTLAAHASAHGAVTVGAARETRQLRLEHDGHRVHLERLRVEALLEALPRGVLDGVVGRLVDGERA